MKKNSNSQTKSGQKMKLTEARGPVQRDSKEVMAELVAKLSERLEQKPTPEKAAEARPKGVPAPNRDRLICACCGQRDYVAVYADGCGGRNTAISVEGIRTHTSERAGYGWRGDFESAGCVCEGTLQSGVIASLICSLRSGRYNQG